MEEKYNKTPPYGIIRYQRGRGEIKDSVIMSEYKIAYDKKMHDLISNMVREMLDTIDGNKEAHRNHDNAKKCINCSRRDGCGERLG